MDGNFSAEHMKMRKESNDVALTNGTGFMAETSRYNEQLWIAKGNTEVSDYDILLQFILIICIQRSSCHNHKAVNQTNVNRKNLDTMGIGATACARHGCFVPSSVVDFQKGERYSCPSDLVSKLIHAEYMPDR